MVVAPDQQKNAHFSMERGMGTMNWVQFFCTVKRVEFFNDRMSYIVIIGLKFGIIVPNVHAPTEDKIDDMKDSFHDELERIFDNIPKYHMEKSLGYSNAKVDKEDIFKTTVGNEYFI
jgi:hypothetical protein